MSHFYLLAIVPDTTPRSSIKDYIARHMVRYDENRTVDEYDEPCHCVGQLARKDAVTQVTNELGSFDSLRTRFKPVAERVCSEYGVGRTWDLPDDGENRLSELWQTHIGEWRRRKTELEDSHPKIGDPDPGCDTCGGKGTHKSTYNPESKWDWYCVGGRWDGAITKTPNDGDGFNFDTSHETLDMNCTTVASALEIWDSKTDTPYAILGPDGSWYAKGRMLMFGVSDDKGSRSDWCDETHSILERYRDGYLAVGLDCHI